MGWIKRNLFFVIGLAIALLLLGAAVYYDFQSWRGNEDAMDKLTEVNSSIQSAENYRPSPGNRTIDNISTAREQQQQLQDWLTHARNNFQPISPIPNPPDGQVSSEMFAPALNQTIRQLQKEAQDAGVQLPPEYYFSFTAQSDKAVFDSSTLGQVAQQLGEVKAIVEILYEARINGLEGIQRVSVSKDDAGGDQADYITDQPLTENMAVLTPYQVTFRGFSSDIANVLSKFASSPYGFVVQNVSVLPATAAQTAPGEMNRPQFGNPYANMNNAAQAATPQTMPTTRNGMQTILNEQMLRVTLKIQIVKLTPNS